jgi:glycosyltransferase involved in cell wall biosynthesis
LARICADKGLHLLVAACERLVGRAGIPPFELHAAGYLGAGDRPYFRDIERQVASGKLAGKFHYHGAPDRAEKIAFLQTLDVFTTPTVYRESKGFPALEAMANGIPVVLPNHGSFPEMVAATDGGLLCTPHDVGDLADKLAELLLNPQRAHEMGSRGRSAVHELFHASAMAERTVRLYEQLAVGSSRSESS